MCTICRSIGTKTALSGKVLGGWEISGITTIQTGQSLSITQGSDPFGAVTVPTSVGGCAISATTTFLPALSRRSGHDATRQHGANPRRSD